MRSMGIVLVCTCAAFSLVACGKDPETRKREYFAAAEQHVKEGKFAEAVIQFRSALQQDSKFGEARFALAEVLEKTGDVNGAFREYIRAADLLPHNIDALLKAGEFNLRAGRF